MLVVGIARNPEPMSHDVTIKAVAEAVAVRAPNPTQPDMSAAFFLRVNGERLQESRGDNASPARF